MVIPGPSAPPIVHMGIGLQELGPQGREAGNWVINLTVMVVSPGLPRTHLGLS